MSSAPREENRVPGLVAKSDADNTPIILEADPVTKRLKVNATITGGGAGGGPATIADGADVAEGATTDAAVTAGSAGTVSGKLRQISADLNSIKANTANLASTQAVSIAGTVTVDDLAAAPTGAAVPANAQYSGSIAQTSLPTAATAGNLTGNMVDKFGRQVVLVDGLRDIVGMQTTTITTSTAETTVVTALASTFLDVTSVMIANTSATATRVDFRDTTAGSVLFSIYCPAGDTRGIVVHTPMPQTSVNTNWTAQSSVSVTDLRILMKFIKNK